MDPLLTHLRLTLNRLRRAPAPQPARWNGQALGTDVLHVAVGLNAATTAPTLGSRLSLKAPSRLLVIDDGVLSGVDVAIDGAEIHRLTCPIEELVLAYTVAAERGAFDALLIAVEATWEAADRRRALAAALDRRRRLLPPRVAVVVGLGEAAMSDGFIAGLRERGRWLSAGRPRA